MFEDVLGAVAEPSMSTTSAFVAIFIRGATQEFSEHAVIAGVIHDQEGGGEGVVSIGDAEWSRLHIPVVVVIATAAGGAQLGRKVQVHLV